MFTYLSVKSYGNKDIKEIKEENKVNKEMFSMYVEQDDGSYQEYTATNLFAIEDAWQDIVPAKIGLMYLHDYYFAYPKDCEIIMDRYYYERGQQWIVWGIFSSSYGVDMLQTFEFYVRTVFYLNYKVYIIKGSGTSTDPYIIS